MISKLVKPKLNSTQIIKQNIDQYFTNQIQSLKQAQIAQGLYLEKIGPHIRHSYNFIDNFLKQFESGEIDYEKRERESRISTVIIASKDIGLEYLQNSINQLTSKTLEDKLLLVTTDFGTTQSNTNNELTTIASHTMHHLGIIGEILKYNQVKLPNQFGYAPSTINYENSK